jgi:hypothetical protein
MTGNLFILYVKDQWKSTEFYSHVLEQKPALFVQGMTEFELSDDCSIGIMPESDIKELLGEKLEDPAQAGGIPRCEIYLRRKKAEEFFQRALAQGATEISSMAKRPWGDRVGYCLDPDGHVLAFCEA